MYQCGFFENGQLKLISFVIHARHIDKARINFETETFACIWEKIDILVVR